MSRSRRRPRRRQGEPAGAGRDESARIRDAYAGNYERLLQIKKRYDPDNLFRFNHNIRPGA